MAKREKRFEKHPCSFLAGMGCDTAICVFPLSYLEQVWAVTMLAMCSYSEERSKQANCPSDPGVT